MITLIFYRLENKTVEREKEELRSTAEETMKENRRFRANFEQVNYQRIEYLELNLRRSIIKENRIFRAKLEKVNYQRK